nr:HigA family addiction module antitoxin [Stappia sediminis]
MERVNTHPGEVLEQEFLLPLDMNATQLAKAIGVPANRITEIVAERRSISADTALRLSAFFGTSAKFWLNLQASYDLMEAQAEHSYKDIEPYKAA